MKNRNSELRKSQRIIHSPSQSQRQDWYEEEQRERREQFENEQRERQREDQRKAEILDRWYREYVTIDVTFEYHIINREYNQDYWEPRSDEIRVTRREAIALIEAGEGAIIGRLGYSNRSLIRNIGYKVPYGLYTRPYGC